MAGPCRGAFKGCRLCRRPPKHEEYIINLRFFQLLCSRDHANLVRIEFSSKLPQELCQIIEYCSKNESHTFQKMDFNNFVKKTTFMMGLWETNWGKITGMTVGSFQVFIKIVTLICVLQVRVHVFPKTSISCSLFKKLISLEDRYVRRLYV